MTESLRERNKREKLERILGAGRDLFREHGYAATTTRMLAERAGIGAGTLFTYVKDKQELLVRVFVNDIDHVADAALAAVDEDAPLVDQVMAIFDAIYGWYERDLELGRHLLGSMLFLRPTDDGLLRGSTARFVVALGDLVERAKARGEVRQDVPSRLAAAALFSHYYFTLVSWLAGNSAGRRGQTAILEELLRLTMKGMGDDAGATTERRNS